ncbi:MAG: YkgJ family cysteine cluster protein [Candidatus Sumerlaeia bacterium]|nr:YkgJ family cysteine cluster protein [Candidatus Sumerlaeia bacterium]
MTPSTASSHWSPAAVHYECHGCGDCCQFPSPIFVSEAEAQSITALPWAGDSPLHGVQTVIPTRDAEKRPTHRLAKQAGSNRCIFLSQENRCRIHEEFGEQWKPAACRAFPRVAVPLAGEHFQHYSLACRCVRLRTFEEWSTPLTTAESTPFLGHETELVLASGARISAMAFRRWVAPFLNFFRSPMLTPVESVHGAYRFMELTLSGNPNLPSAEVLEQAVAASLPAKVKTMEFPRRLDASQRSLLFQVLFHALNPAPVDFHERSLTAQEAEKAERLQRGEAFRDEVGSPMIWGAPLNTTFAEVRRVACGMEEAQLRETFGVFLAVKLVGLRFHSDPRQHFTVSVHQLLLSCAMILWVAKAKAAEEGLSHFTLEHLDQGIRLIDSSLGTLPLTMLPRKVQEAWATLFHETTFASTAFAELLGDR